MKILRNNIDTKDFNQEDIHRFLTYGGKEMYEKEPEFSSIPKNVKLNSLKRGTFKKSDIQELVKIVFPFNQRTYDSRGMFWVWNEKDKLEKDLDILVNVNSGIMTFPDAPLYLPLATILTKYWKPDCGWNYVFIRTSYYNPPKPVISVPLKKENWKTLLQAFTEFLIFLKLFIGAEFRIYFHDSKTPDPKQKEFSEGNIASWIPTAVNLGYSVFLAPILQKRLALKVSNAGKPYNTSFETGFKKFLEKNYPDLVLVKLGTGSCYINPQNIPGDVLKALRKEADPERLRTMLDWILWGHDNKKHILFSSDLDNALAMCHEVGHYLIDIGGGAKKWLHVHQRKGITNQGFISFVAFCLGLLGNLGEAAGIVSSWLLKTPMLYTEFLASYIGLDVLKQAGGTEKEIEEAKKVFKAAWGTYFNNAARTGSSASWGRLVRLGIDKYKDSML